MTIRGSWIPLDLFHPMIYTNLFGRTIVLRIIIIVIIISRSCCKCWICLTLVLLVDKNSGQMFAVCPIKDGAVDRCVDSSRYFVLRIENSNGRHMFIGMAFNERNDAFDFNTSLEDAKREREAAKEPPVNLPDVPSKDYSIKEGEKIVVNIRNKIVSNHGCKWRRSKFLR
jgi:hypothetical protein